MDGADSAPPPGADALLLSRVTVQQLDDLLADPVQVSAELHEDLGGNAVALADQAKQYVFGTDVVMTELQRLTQR